MGAKPRGYRGNLEKLDVAGESDAARRSSEADVDELLNVEGSVEVSGFRDGRGDLDSRGVDGLPAVVAIDATRDFADENGRQALASDFLVNAEEIDLRVNGQKGDATSTILTDLPRMLTVWGVAVMKPYRWPLFVPRTPI